MSSSKFANFNPQLNRVDRIKIAVLTAGEKIARTWPIRSFIAINHLAGFENLPFHEAMHQAGRLYGRKFYMNDEYFSARRKVGQVLERDDNLAALRISRFPKYLENLATSLQDESSEQLKKDNRSIKEELPEKNFYCISDWLESASSQEPVKIINEEMSKWLGAFLDEGISSWSMPGREIGFFSAWKSLVAHDATLRFYGINDAVETLQSLSDSPEDTIGHIFDILGVGQSQEVDYLTRMLAQMPGYPSYIKWLQENTDRELNIDLSQYFAVRLFYEYKVCDSIARKLYGVNSNIGELDKYISHYSTRHDSRYLPDGLSSSPHNQIEEIKLDLEAVRNQEALEASFERSLLGAYKTDISNSVNLEPLAQFVFCIDVRSERIRRHIESVGNYETRGFAGFFGLPVTKQDLISPVALDLCPVLLKPRHSAFEIPDCKLDHETKLESSIIEFYARKVSDSIRKSPVASFLAVEILGITSFFSLISKSLANKFSYKQHEKRIGIVSLDSNKSVERLEELNLSAQSNMHHVRESGFSPKERIFFAETILKLMGLYDCLSPLVVLTGHGSASANNPHASSLDCGACGGNPGGFSARAVCELLNEDLVRAGLKERDIYIPEHTWFTPAEHNTTTDEIVLLEKDRIPERHKARVERLIRDLDDASMRCLTERVSALPVEKLAFTVGDPKARSIDWSEVRPEWGLARNAAFIAGPREKTIASDLGARAFLHCYDYRKDPDNKVLETIMTAPLIVAQWINMQYYLSTVTPDIFGAGDKALHNVVGGFGVLEGAGGDLRIGLPLQSVMYDDQNFYHEPLRLHALIEAPVEKIDAVIIQNSDLRELLVNKWIKLFAFDIDSFYEFIEPGNWSKLLPEELPADLCEQERNLSNSLAN